MTDYNGPERREHTTPCEMLIEFSTKTTTLKTEMTDFFSRYERDRIEDKEWCGIVETGIKNLTESIMTLNETIRSMNRPYVVMKWLGAIILGGFLTAGGYALFEFLKSAIHFGK